jgi:hypothetical protein
MGEVAVHRRRFLLLLLAVAMWAGSLLVPLASPAAQDGLPPGLSMRADAAFDGIFKYGEWLPVWVELANSGPDLDVEVRVRLTGSWGTTTFAGPVALPTGSRKRVPIYVLPNNYSHELQVELTSDGKVLASQRVPVAPRVNVTYLVGLVAPQRGALALLLGASLPGQNRIVDLVDVSVSELPERSEALRSFDCLVFNDVDTSSLTPDQAAALEAWVQQGGRLVVGGGAGARRTAAGLPPSLLAIVPRNEVELNSVDGLARLAEGEAIRVPGPFLVAGGEAAPGVTLAAEGDLPLVHERLVGSGSVDWVALDLATSPFDAWSGTTSFWERLLGPGAAYPPWLAQDMSARQMQAGSMTYALSNLPALDLPSVQGLALLLAVYVLVIGPLNYLVLRWRRRLHLAWVTIPVLTLLFAGGAFGLGYAMRGSDVILNKISVVSVQPDGNASMRSYVGLFSPSQRSYEIQVPGEHLLSPLNPDYNPWGPGGLATSGEMVFVQGQSGAVRGLAVNQWSMQALMVEGNWPGFGRISGDLRLDAGSIVGRVRNETGYTLQDAVLILGNGFVRLGDLAPGQEAAIKMEVGNSASQPFGSPISYRLFEAEFNRPGPNGVSREVQLKQTLVDSLFQQGGKFGPSPMASSQAGALSGLFFMGWLAQAPPEIQVEGRAPMQQAISLVYAPLAYELPQEGQVSLPPGLISGTLLEVPQEGGFCGSPGTTAIYIGRGQGVFEFRAPLVGELDVRQLNLTLRSDGGWWQSPGVAIYDWTADDWADMGPVNLGTVALADAGHLVSDDGRVRIRLTSEGGGGNCIYLDLGMEGTRR